MRARSAFAAMLGAVLLGAAPAPSPQASPSPRITITCIRTPMWVFTPGNDRPSRTPEPEAKLGETFALVGGPRSTLDGTQFYETNVTIVEPGLPGHYWVLRTCANPV
ncbi:hypothetical protein WPS_10170 [Vulcanimicrobium alpinum]|uniref:Secreted protein n=1 Tax=Vulcanimicrobium alpinum TaxID=3016050 RepID=A0AAN2C980_UNVUL|nr:hypothetical protein [Vulcanimicrobium alpinum]BDE05741.1 hypothetical protein WPS_10170 [Vulcanimicrobium alpinum]